MLCRKRTFLTAIAMCYVAASHVAQARPGFHGDSHGTQLMPVPDLSSFSNLHYPQLDLIDLGSSSQGHLPPSEIKVSKTITIKEPYPVKVPHKVPYPVHIPKPYPVPVTKVVKVPQPIPVEVVKNIHIPVEVPKPYPVPEREFHGNQGGSGYSGGGGGGGGGAAFGSQPYGASTNGEETVHYQYGGYRTIQNYAQDNGDSLSGSGERYEQNNNDSGEDGGYGHEDRSNGYVAITAADATSNGYGRMGQEQHEQQQEGHQDQQQKQH